MQPGHIMKGGRKEKGARLSLLQTACEQQARMGRKGVRDSRREQLGPDSNPGPPAARVMEDLQEGVLWSSATSTLVLSEIPGILATLTMIMN